MSLIIATKIQNTVPDSIEYADNLQLAIRANGEQRVSFIDLAGNVYNAEIPQPVNAPTFTSVTVATDGISPVGWYGYRYVYAATTRYPLVDGGQSIGGSIAPRGNPSPTLVHQLTNNNYYNNLSLSVCDRLDVSEIWVFRTINYALQADAQTAIDAGLCFYVGKVANAPGTGTVAFQDKAVIPGLDQIEFDNFPAPTFEYARYIPPYFWGIGNDHLILPVQWNGQIVTITNGGQWFDGRNGQQANVSGITTGGVDGVGTFIFKAGDTAGFNQQINCILTKDGVTPETLVPATGTGYIKIQGPGNILFRSKPNNPLAWGETTVIGSERLAQVYTLAIATGDATAIIGLPEQQSLKLDFKNPPACYLLNLRLAGTPEFGTSLNLISNYSVSSHNSQFVASIKSNSTITTVQEVRKMLWGWDSDNFAILQCDGSAQVPVSDPIFKTLRNVVTDPYRLRFAHGICDDENELNCLWIPNRGQPNFQSGYPGDPYYKQAPITDLLIYQHIPSGKWGYSMEFDLTSAAKVRDLNLNKLRILGGTESGLILSINEIGNTFYIVSLGAQYNNVTLTNGINPSITFPAGTWSGFDPTLIPGTWMVLCDLNLHVIYLRAISLVGDTITFNMLLGDSDTTQGIFTEQGAGLPGLSGTNLLSIGGIPKSFKKRMEFSNPVELKRIEALYLKGDNLASILTQISNWSTTRNPLSFQDNVEFSEQIWSVPNPALPQDMAIELHFFEPFNFMTLKGIGIKLNT